MSEHIAPMGPMPILGGLVAAWMAETGSRAGGYGFKSDMAVGLIGSVIGGTVVWIFVSTGLSTGPGKSGMFLIGCAAAVVAIVAQRGLWRSSRLGA